MKSLSLALLGLASAAAAVEDLDKRYWTSVECKEKTVTLTDYVHTKYVTVTGPPPPSKTVYTGGGQVTSVDHSTKWSQMYLPSAGVYQNQYVSGQYITATGPMYVDVEVPYSTIYVFPTGSAPGSKDCTKVIYQDKVVIEVVVIEIFETVAAGSTQYHTGTAKSASATWTPPPYNTNSASTTYSAPPSKKTIPVELRADMINGKTVVHYVPDQTDAEIGDVILFKFFAAAHSATQSEFLTPCTPKEGGFDSGLIPNPNNTDSAEFQREFTVTTKDPLWFYCKQPVKNHCGQGMVFGINPNGKMDEFISRAIAQNGALVTQTVSTSGSTATVTITSTTISAAGYNPPAATHTVIVEGTINLTTHVNTLQFDPPLVPRVNKGDTLLFDFRKLNHTLTESTFQNPCTKKPGGLDTDFHNFNAADIPLQNTTSFVINIDSNTPRWFYCKQANGKANGHCHNGMVFAINTDMGTFEKFKENAEKTPVTLAGKRANRYGA